MPLFTDQTGQIISLDKLPKRIISLVPSQTELLYDLGLDEEVAGITKFCVHPQKWFHSKTRVGGTKQIKIDVIHSLNPDLVIANKEENVKEQVEALSAHYPVWVSNVNNLEDAYNMIDQIGLLTNKVNRSKEIINGIRESFSQLPTCLLRLRRSFSGARPDKQAPDSGLRTAYLIWQKPYMTVGGDTFIHSMMQAAGFENINSNKTRYPEITIDDLRGCQLLLLSSEPFPFKQKHIDELQPHLPGTKIILADGEMFSWYGSRLLHAPLYFKKLRQAL